MLVQHFSINPDIHGIIGKLANIWILITSAPLNKCTLKKYDVTLNKGNQDVKVSEKRGKDGNISS